jgi:hypothetical protein
VVLVGEVVELRPVARVVVDHDQHAKAQPNRRLQFGDPHEEATVAERGDRQPVGAGQADAWCLELKAKSADTSYDSIKLWIRKSDYQPNFKTKEPNQRRARLELLARQQQGQQQQ